MNKIIGKIALLSVAIVWGTGFVASTVALDYFSPYQILALRFTIAFIVLFILHFKKVKTLKKSTVKRGVVLGLFLFLAFATQTIGLQYTTTSKNAFLTAVNVVIVPFLAWIILKRKIAIREVGGAVITLIGIVFLSLSGAQMDFTVGDVLTLVCAIFFALQIFFTDMYIEEEEAWALTMLQMGVAALLSWIMVGIQRETFTTITLTSLAPVLYLGLMCTLFAYLVQTIAQKNTTSTEAAIILSLESFFGMIGSVILLHEQVTGQMIVGAVLIFVGILIVELKPSKIQKN